MIRIFVFGSNLAGIHGAGSALHAHRNFGAARGIGEGMTGRAYAIPTKDHDLKTLPLEVIKKAVDRFIFFANEHPGWEFELVAIGCGLAGYKPEDIAPLFRKAPSNVYLPLEFKGVLA